MLGWLSWNLRGGLVLARWCVVASAVAAWSGCGAKSPESVDGAEVQAAVVAGDDGGIGSEAGPDGGVPPDGAEPDGAELDAGDDVADQGAATDVEAADAAADAADALPGACSTSADCPQPATGCLGNTCIGGVCQPQTLPDATPCADGDPCTAKAACSGGACKAIDDVDCGDDDACTVDGCDAKTGACTHTPAAAGVACEDGNPCTTGTTCDGKPDGSCQGGSNSCGCSTLADCAAYDDADLCNGTLYCNLGLATPTCQVLPSSVVVCQGSGDDACQQTQCSAFTGQCEALPASDGKPCDDGNPCSLAETCQSGACKAPVNTCACQVAADCIGSDDGNPCNGTLYCDTSALPYSCKVNPASVVVCNAKVGPCQTTACDSKSGACAPLPAKDGLACEDGVATTVGDTCQAGKCQPGVSTAQCSGDADCAKLEDGDICNGVLFCNKQTSKCELNPATVVSCPSVDDTQCAKTLCQPKTGLCALTALAGSPACDDGNPCTKGDHCQDGGCQSSANTCQCQKDADCAGKEDGDQCNGTLFCDKPTGQCQVNPATVKTCPSVADTSCSKAVCLPKTGQCEQKPLPDLVGCDDGSPCTDADACQAGACVGTKVCACQVDADCEGQDDGDLCNGTLYCNKKSNSCEVNPATVKVCPSVDDSACQQSKCQPKTGQCALTATSNGVSCDADGNPCTQNDFCSGGGCKPGKVTCECNADADCDGKQGDNKCIPDMFCDKQSHSCKPAQQVQCDSSKDGKCAETACDPVDGTCKTALLPVGTICGESAICAGAQVCDSKGACVAGAASDCDDADACTKDTCDAKKGCTFNALDAGPCDDGDICSAGDQCAKGQCVGTTKDCTDSSPCTNDACDPKTGCVYLPSGATSCDDGDLCTVGDFCLQTLCLPGSKVLSCDDGNPCTQDACDAKQGCVQKAQDGGKCDDGDGCTKFDACSAGSCKGVQLSCDDGSGCTVDSCDKDEGCLHKAQVGKACDDGNACTVSDACISSGLCASGQPKVCDDANPCTVDLCDPLQGCVKKEVVGSKCDDGNACTVNEKCDKGLCTGSPRNCDDGLVCSKDSCDKDAGCLYAVTAGSKCDDGNSCTAGDLCAKGGACVPGPGLSCDDNNGCTTDACDPASGCTHKALDGIGCSDGDSCTQTDKCVAGACKGVGKSCDDGLVCTSDGCDPAGGCSHKVQQGATCSDNDACTQGDTCLQSGYCKPGATVSCDDNNACTADTCAAQKGCQQEIKAGVGCSDGTACTINDACDAKGACIGSPLSCDDGKACTTDTCDKLGGCKTVANTNQPCSDSNACTTGDVCLSSGTCAPTGQLPCVDGNTCTTDACAPASGCVHAAQDKASCSDGSACTANDSCNGHQCVGSPVSCDDSQTCTKDSCDKQKGCVFAPQQGAACNDGNACTAGDLCSAAGTCTPGSGVNCDDAKVCTADSCDAASGCKNTALEAISCSDGDACTVADACAQGACKGTVQVCDDGNACTTDACDKLKGCTATAKTGVLCSDGSACTGQDACSSFGKCVGTKVTCNDNSVCTLDLCDVDLGCVFTKLSGASCSDGKLCTVTDSCSDGVCAGAAKNCDDGNECTADSCDAVSGCVSTATAVKPCNDGDECTTGDSCAASKCVGADKNCGDGNGCTLETCHKTLGCQVSLAKVNEPCSDGDACTADWCDGLGGCDSTPLLGSRQLPMGYIVDALVVDSTGTAWAVGKSDSVANGGFIARLKWKGKSPPLALNSKVNRWTHALVVPPEAKPHGGFAAGVLVAGRSVQTDTPPMVFGGSSPFLTRFTEAGTVVVAGFLKLGGDPQPDAVVALAADSHVVVGAAVRYGAVAKGDYGWKDNGTFGANPNGIYLSTAKADFGPLSQYFYAVAPAGMERLAVHDLAVHLDANGNRFVVGLATIEQQHNTSTFMLRAPILALDKVVATQVWTAGANADDGWRLAGYNRLLTTIEGGFDIVLGNREVRRYGPLGTFVSTHAAGANLPKPLLHVAQRGRQFVGVTDETPPNFYVMRRSLSAPMHTTKLLTEPKLMALGPGRDVFFVERSLAYGIPVESVERRDPWAQQSCSECMTVHAAGCKNGNECHLDSCNAADGKCDGSSQNVYCDDGNACTTDVCTAGKCVHTAATASAQVACPLDLSKCKQGLGVCGVGGVCAGSQGNVTCVPSSGVGSPECALTRCSDDVGCISGKQPGGFICKKLKESPTHACTADTATCVGMLATQGLPFKVEGDQEHETKATLAISPKTTGKWARLTVDIEILACQEFLASDAFGGLELDVGQGQVIELRARTSQCDKDLVGRSCFPALSRRLKLTFPDDGVPVDWSSKLADAQGPFILKAKVQAGVVKIHSAALTLSK